MLEFGNPMLVEKEFSHFSSFATGESERGEFKHVGVH
jgi:hypothetical protein